MKSAASRLLRSEALGKHASQTCSPDVIAPESITTDLEIASACADKAPGTRSGQCNFRGACFEPKTFVVVTRLCFRLCKAKLMPDCPMTLDALRLYMSGCIAPVMATDAARDIQTSTWQSNPPAPVLSRRPSDVLLHGIDTVCLSQPTPVNANVRLTAQLPC